MAINRKVGLVGLMADGRSLLPIEFNDQDEMECLFDPAKITIPPGPNQFVQLLAALENRGIGTHGCFNCRYFTKGGLSDETNHTGMCLEGKRGIELMLSDLTTSYSSCDAYELGDQGKQALERAEWADSLAASRRG